MRVMSIEHTRGSQRVRVQVEDDSIAKSSYKKLYNVLRFVDEVIPTEFLNYFRADCVWLDDDREVCEVSLTLSERTSVV